MVALVESLLGVWYQVPRIWSTVGEILSLGIACCWLRHKRGLVKEAQVQGLVVEVRLRRGSRRLVG